MGVRNCNAVYEKLVHAFPFINSKTIILLNDF